MRMLKVRRALISVSDKQGIEDLSRRLHRLGVEIISTGGTAHAIESLGIPVVRVESITNTPEILSGRIKTLHPVLYAGILALRDNPFHMAVMKEIGAKEIDMVVVNLYPFVERARKGSDLKDLLETIDIGGVCLIRAAAKNFEHVAVVTTPEQYEPVLRELEMTGGLSNETLRSLAVQAFMCTSDYDGAIHRHMSDVLGLTSCYDQDWDFVLRLKKVADLRYGENPHNRGFLLTSSNESIATADLLQGKEMSYNNYLDAYAAARIVAEFDEPAIAIVKHTNPCGVATNPVLRDAYLKALETDRISAYGGIVASNRPLDEDTAWQIIEVFTEVVVAPDYDDDALSILRKRKKMRVLKWPRMLDADRECMHIRSIGSAYLGQTMKEADISFTVPTKRSPTRSEWDSLRFAWKVVKYVKSNAVVLAKGTRTVAIGAGQMSRIASVEIALNHAGKKARGAVMASDGFFPFRDSIDAASDGGVTAVIQPGGSIRDQEVIRAADEHAIAMVFTHVRCFLH